MQNGAFRYYQGFQSVRGTLSGLPSWARFIIGILALPGIALLALSLLAVLVSILALLLLTVPAYRFLQAITVRNDLPPTTQAAAWEAIFPSQNPESSGEPSPGRKRVDVKVVE